MFLLIQKTLNYLSKACFYTKLNLIYAFNRLCIAEGDKWLIAFRTQYGLFKYLMMLFGFANALSLFQHFVNNILCPYLDVFCTVYINNILIYSNNMAKQPAKPYCTRPRRRGWKHHQEIVPYDG